LTALPSRREDGVVEATLRQPRTDRRCRSTPALSRYWLRGRRRGGRREGEIVDCYVDRYRPIEWALLLGLLGLAFVDWVWTLAHVSRGIEEANPLLALALQGGGVVGFSLVKLAATLVPIAILALHVRFRVARALLPVAIAVYVVVLAVHVATQVAASA
jgi:hypothetical protein